MLRIRKIAEVNKNRLAAGLTDRTASPGKQAGVSEAGEAASRTRDKSTETKANKKGEKLRAVDI